MTVDNGDWRPSTLELGTRVQELENAAAAVAVTLSVPSELTPFCSLGSPALPPSAPNDVFSLVTCQ